MNRALAIFLSLSVLARPAAPQPDPQPQSPPLSPAAVIAQAQAACRSGPLADDMTVRIGNQAHRSRSAHLVLRLDAHEPGFAAIFRLEFGETRNDASLVVYTTGGSLTAANTDNENDRWIVSDASPDLASILSHLPPLPVPQFALAFDASSAFDQPTPYTPGVVWDSADSPRPRFPADRPEIALRGRASSGPVQAAFDASTFRFRSFHADLESGLTLDITAEPIPPGDPSQWPIITAGRRIVPNLSDLAPQRGAIKPGEYVPDIGYTRADGSGWSLHQALAALPPAQPGAPAPAVVLVCFRVSADPTPLAAAEASAHLAVAAVRLAAQSSATLDTHLIAAIDLAAYGDQWPALQQRWGAEAAQGAPPGWATPSTSMSRFAPGAQAALVLIAPDRRLLAVINLDGESGTRTITDEVSAALR